MPTHHNYHYIHPCWQPSAADITVQGCLQRAICLEILRVALQLYSLILYVHLTGTAAEAGRERSGAGRRPLGATAAPAALQTELPPRLAEGRPEVRTSLPFPRIHCSGTSEAG